MTTNNNTETLSPLRPIVYLSSERCACGAVIDMQTDSGTLTFARMAQPDGSRPLRIIECSMCPTRA